MATDEANDPASPPSRGSGSGSGVETKTEESKPSSETDDRSSPDARKKHDDEDDDDEESSNDEADGDSGRGKDDSSGSSGDERPPWKDESAGVRQDSTNSETEEEEDSEDDDDFDDNEGEEEEDDDDEDDDDYDDDDGSFSWWKEIVVDGWRQHLFAVLLAVAATAVAHCYYNAGGEGGRDTRQHPTRPAMAPTLHHWAAAHKKAKRADRGSGFAVTKHEHLQSYRRTANVMFCGDGSAGVGDPSDESPRQPRNSDRSPSLFDDLHLMDFSVPRELIATMKLHYWADAADHDSYHALWEDAEAAAAQTAEKDNGCGSDNVCPAYPLLNDWDEYQCLLREENATTPTASSNGNRIKGWTYYYRSPDIDEMYPESFKRQEEQQSILKKTKKLQAAQLTFTGFAAKFVNLSPEPVLLHWDGRAAGSSRLVGELPPMESLGTATTPGQSFHVSPVHDSGHALRRWVVTADTPVLYYDPLSDEDEGAFEKKLTARQRDMYRMQLLNKEFAMHYLAVARRPWLAHFPRAVPVHYMYPAGYMGQQHAVQVPPEADEASGGDGGRARTLRLTVQSVAPRVLTIKNFVSPAECRQLKELAQSEGMQASSLYSGGAAVARQPMRDRSTRSSSNAWLARGTDEVTDRIYRRAAAVLKMNPDLLQPARIDEDLNPHYHAAAESLQVIRYHEGEEYTAHHDFVHPPATARHQPTRFATLLFYLNDDFEGGETVFPRSVNAKFHEGLVVKPVQGTAVLFYNMLPDGNVDDLAQHSSRPVTKGEKFAANIWIWDPLIN